MKILKEKPLKTEKNPIFVVKKVTRRNGDIEFIPMCRSNNPLGFDIKILREYERIVKIYGTYHTLDIDIPEKLTEEEAIEHIEGYKKQLAESHGDDVVLIQTFET